MHNKLYNHAILADLYARARQEWKLYLQWYECHAPYHAVEHFTKCTALVELMENIYCFNVGLGADGKQFANGLEARLNSFNFVKE